MRQDTKSYMIVERQSGYIFTIKHNNYEAKQLQRELELLHGKKLWKIVPIYRDYVLYHKFNKTAYSYGRSIALLYKKLTMEDGIMSKYYNENYELYVNHEVLNSKTIYINDIEHWRINYEDLKKLCKQK